MGFVNEATPNGHLTDATNQEMGFVTEEEKKKNGSNGNTWWPTVKPFVNGGLAGLASDSLILSQDAVLIYADHYLLKSFYEKSAAKMINVLPSKARYNSFLKEWIAKLPIHVTSRASSIGLLEILRKNVAAANEGIPLTIFQEACCGFFAGAAATSICIPYHTAYSHMRAGATRPAVAQPFSYRNIFDAMYRIAANEGVFALWKKGTPRVKALTPYFMGMLSSYYPSRDYFEVSVGYDETWTQLGAGAVSGFFASAFYVPTKNVLETKQYMQKMKYSCTSSLDCALRILQAKGVPGLYTGFLLTLVGSAPHIMMTWIVFEEIQKFQKSIGL